MFFSIIEVRGHLLERTAQGNDGMPFMQYSHVLHEGPGSSMTTR